MAGLDKILKYIEEGAVTSSNSIILEADNKSKEIIAAAMEEGEKKCKEIENRSKLEIQAYLSRAESTARLQEKKLILNAKQELINDVIANSRDLLLKLPDKEYFDIIIKMVKKFALEQSGQIIFSKNDKNRLPVNFDTDIQAALLNKNGAILKISEETIKIDGGFILSYGEVEENCSFEALFFAEREHLQDKVSQLLFDNIN